MDTGNIVIAQDDESTSGISSLPKQMEILGYKSDNVLVNLTTSSLILLFLFGCLILLIFFELLFKVIDYQKG